MEIVKAMEFAKNIRFNLIGKFKYMELKQEIRNMSKSLNTVNELGFLSRWDASAVMHRSKAGLVLFHDIPIYTDSQSNKIFEYMSVGLPVISSNFPMWKDMIEENSCGMCVDHLNIKDISDAIKFIIYNGT